MRIHKRERCITGIRAQLRIGNKDLKLGGNHTQPLLSNMLIAPTTKSLLRWVSLVVVVANPLLSQLKSSAIDVVRVVKLSQAWRTGSAHFLNKLGWAEFFGPKIV